jgi:hypothetical protein
MWVALAITPAALTVVARARPSSTSWAARLQAPSSTQVRSPVRCRVWASAWSSPAWRMIAAASTARSGTRSVRSPRRTCIAAAASRAQAASRCSQLSRTISSRFSASCRASATSAAPSRAAARPAPTRGLRHQLGTRERRQLDDVDAVGVAVDQPDRGLVGQPGLARAAGAGQGEQSGAAERLADLGELTLAPMKDVCSGRRPSLTPFAGRDRMRATARPIIASPSAGGESGSASASVSRSR